MMKNKRREREFETRARHEDSGIKGFAAHKKNKNE